LFLIALHYY